MVTSKEIKEVIDKEVKWSKENPDKSGDMTEKEREAFIAGLLQVKLLIQEMEEQSI